MRPEGISHARPEAELIDFPELFRTFNRYKWGVVAIAVLTASAAALVAFSMRPTFRGAATVLIEPKSERPVKYADVYDPGYEGDQYLTTQFALLSSRDLAEKTIDKLGLMEKRDLIGGDDPEASSNKFDLRKWLPFLPERPDRSDTVEARNELRESVVKDFMERVTIDPIRRTQLVVVQFDSYSPELSAQVANTLADLYIESGFQARLDATKRATNWLTEKLSDIKAQLEKSEAALQAFREKEQIVSVNGVRTLSESELIDYNQRFRDVQKQRQELQNAYEKIRLAGNDTRRLRDISALLQDQNVQRANNSVLESQEQVKQLQERYGSRHPLMAAAQAKYDTALAAFNEQLRIAAAGVKTQYEIALENEKSMEQQVASSRAQLQNLDRKDYALSVLLRDVTSNRELYDTFLARFKETNTSGSFESMDARVVDPAVVPTTPVKPDKKKVVLIAGVGGLLLGLLLALLRHLLSEEVHSADELETLTRLPVYGVLPLVAKPLIGQSNMARVYLEKPKSPFGEGVRSVRAALQLSDVDKRFKRVMITSSVPKEGKSSVASTLALSFGAIERVCLVDCDLRIPSVGKIFDFPVSAKGVTDIVLGQATLDQCLLHYEPGGIYVLPAGSMVPNPSELLNLPAFIQMVADLSERFDRVLFDSPPCQAASDTSLLTHHVHAVLFVVKSEATSRRAIKNSLKALQYAQAPLLGNIVNQVDTRRNPYYLDGYYYAYDYYG
jgi:succinoglycan biosynthesis transport protein ExoP